MGWVLTAFQNALYELLHAPTLEDGVIETVRCGGDTDTNGAICGALLGAVYGRDAVPEQWVDRIAKCRPTHETAQPRPKEYWPNDALRLAEKLLQAGGTRPRISFLDEPLAKFTASLDDCMDPDEPGMKRWGSFADVLEFDDGRHKVDRHRLPKGKVRRCEVFELAADPNVSIATVCVAAMAWGGMRLRNFRRLCKSGGGKWLSPSRSPYRTRTPTITTRSSARQSISSHADSASVRIRWIRRSSEPT